MHINIDKHAYCNRLLSVHPMEKFLFAIITLFLCIFLNSPAVSITVLVLNSFILVYKAGIKSDCYIKFMLLPLYFLFAGTLTIAFNLITPDIKAIFYFHLLNFTVGITHESFIQALNLFLKAFGSVSCLYFLTLTTPLIDIISVLRRLKFNELFLELMGLIYRLIFIFMETADRIYNSQDSRLGYNSVKTGFKSLGALVSNLFVLSFSRANQLFTALESRGYTGSINVLESEYEFSHKNMFLIILAEILLLTVYLSVKLYF